MIGCEWLEDVMIMFNGYRALIGKIKSSETEEW
jgi:hypothetical protein